MLPPRFRFGVDYYPEHWDRSRWSIDAGLMRAAGFNTVRLAEFAWAKLEPEPGRFDFAWLDDAIRVLTDHDLQIVIGTPTAAPPAWVMQRHPDAYRMFENGQRQTYGNRRCYCPNHPGYRAQARQIVTALADHYSGSPHIIAWQTDNEFGQGDRCCCPICAAAFQRWLQAKYGTLDALNDAWGTTFWSHIYGDWAHIPAPLKTGVSPNPSLALDYYRFSSDSYQAFQREQIDILRARLPKALITHNLMGMGFAQLDYHRFAADLDFVSWDIYPRSQWSFEQGLDSERVAFSHDLMRGIKGQNYWVMEQQSGHGGWEIVSTAPRPGEIRLWAYQSIAHGADGILFFRWRTARHGTEQYWHGILDHDARPRRRYEEVKRMGGEITRLAERIYASQPRAQAALLYSYDTGFAFQIQPNNPGFDYDAHAAEIYRAFQRAHVPLDVIAPQADFAAYRIVVVPALYIVTPDVAERLKRFVQAGGLVIVTPRTGVKDAHNAVVEMALPGLLAELCGLEVEEYDSLPIGVTKALDLTRLGVNGAAAPRARVWCDVFTLKTAQSLATYAEDYYAGQPMMAHNRYGDGHVVTVGTFGDASLYSALLRWALPLVLVEALVKAPQGVEAALHTSPDGDLLFLLNHTEAPQTILLRKRAYDLLRETAVEGSLTLPAREVAILI